MLQSGGQVLDEGLQMGVLQGRPYLVVRVLVKRVQVLTQSSREQHRVLRDQKSWGVETSRTG